MSPKEDLALLYRIAQNYYIHDYSQNDIAIMESISRPQISRLLKRARETGIVNIQVSLPVSSTRQDMENRLADCFGLEKVILSPSSEDERQNDSSLYFTAANYLGQVLGNFKNIGIGWGRTLYNIALNMAPQIGYENMTFYAVIGTSGTDNPYLQTNSIADRFAECFRAKVCYNNTLALSPKRSLDKMSLARIQQLRRSWAGLDAVVFGMGGRVISEKLYIEEMPKSMYTPQIREKIVGDVLGSFYLDDSTFLQIPADYVLTAMSLSEIRKNKCSICITHGQAKVDALIRTLEGGLVKTLITDENTAKCVLQRIET